MKITGTCLETHMNNCFRIEDVLDAQIGQDANIPFFSLRPLQESSYIVPSNILQQDSLCLCSWNCHLTTGYLDVLQFIEDSTQNIDLIAICETFISSDQSLSSFVFPGYSLEVKNRKSLNRGGLGFLVKMNLNYSIRDDLIVWIEGKIESFCVELEIEKKKIIICLVYKPPSTRLDEFFEGFDLLMSCMSRSGLDFICMGDFNFNLLDLNGDNLDFFNYMVSNDLYPLACVPTRISSHSATLIDNVFVSSKFLNSSYADVGIYPGSDHLPVIARITCVQKTRSKAKKRKVRQLKKANLDKFAEELSTLSWDPVLDITRDVNEAYDTFCSIIQPIYEQTCPLKIVKDRKNIPRKPWMTVEIVQEIENRNHLYEHYLRTEKDEDFEEFRIARNRVNSHRRRAKKVYFEKKFTETKGNSKGTWKVIGEMISKKSSGEPLSIETHGTTIYDPLQVAEHFADYFSKIGPTVQQENNQSPESFRHDEFQDDRGERLAFEFERCTSDELLKIVGSISSNSAGIDGMNLRTFKSVLVYLLPCILHIINLSLETGIFPEGLKTAKVIPLHKGGSRSDVGNWRPISILPLFSKILEKVVHRRLYQYLTHHGLLGDTQFGFRKSHSTTHAVQHLCDFVNQCLNSGKIPLTVFIDFKKAFDTVDFSILLNRLRFLGVKGVCLNWFDSFLKGRSIKVVIDSVTSSPYLVNCGVPQGSVLGPLLYLVYVDTMRFYLPDSCLTSFADDTAISFRGVSVDELINKVNMVLNYLNVFTTLSMLAVNVKKTNFMVFSRIGKPIDLGGRILFSGNSLEQVDLVRYLGFYLDCNMSWKHHSDLVASKVARGLGIIRRLKHFVPGRVMLLLYHAIISPYISYGCVLWASNFFNNFKRVQVLQNKAVRLIGGYVKETNNTVACFRKLKVMDVGQVRDYQAAVFTYQCLHEVCPLVFLDFFRQNNDLHDYDTRNATNLVTEYKSGRRTGFQIKHLGQEVWNSLPDSVKAAEHQQLFKKRVKNFLLGE